jgi:RNA polymerase sigma-70 factor (ECF subfamily)
MPERQPRYGAWSGYLRRIARGDAQALSHLYDEAASLSYALALRILRNPADAEEAVLDSFMQVWRRAGQYVPERGAAQTWLLAIVRNRSIDRLRSRNSTERPALDLDSLPPAAAPAADGASPEESSLLAEQRRTVRGALARLPAATRTALELSYFEGLSHSEIAARLAEPLGTVKTRIRRGLRILGSLFPAEASGSSSTGRPRTAGRGRDVPTPLLH